MLGLLAIVAAALMGACQGQTFVMSPYNTSAEIGGNATIACIVSNLGQNSLQWKKQDSSGSYTLITNNGQPLTNNGKYVLTSTYNLTITSFTSSDEGNYQCTAGSTVKTAYVQSVVLPNNVSVYWETAPRAGGYANITCRATYARPAPFLRWFKNGIEQTSSSDIYYYTDNAQGSYSDAVSTMRVLLTNADEDRLFRCQVDFEGYYDVMEYTLQTQLSGGSMVQAQGMFAMLLASLAIYFRNN